MMDPITQIAAMNGWMREQREKQPPRPGPTMDAWRARIPQDIEQPEHVQQRRPWYEMPSRDELVDMAANMATPMAGTIENVGAKVLKRAAKKPAAKVIEKVATAETPLAIEAWHGSPYRGIDRFSMEKIGTGEGNQSFGHGLYFAEERAVGESYKKKLAKDGEGALYKVRIEASPDDLIDNDALLKNQPKIAERLKPILDDDLRQAGYSGGWDQFAERHTGDGLLERMRLIERRRSGEPLMHKTAPMVSERLKSAGVPGLKYFDGFSRDGGGKTRNFVLWDDERIKILEALGLLGVLGGGGYKAMQPGAPKERRGIQPL